LPERKGVSMIARVATAFLLLSVVVALGWSAVASAIGPDDGTGGGCEDETGTWFPGPDYFASGIRPQGPCLPVGMWNRIREREREENERLRQLEERVRRLERERARSRR
jgi:hypothetical protein